MGRVIFMLGWQFNCHHNIRFMIFDLNRLRLRREDSSWRS